MEADHLDAIRAAMAEKDSRIAELERELRERPVMESDAAKEMREAWENLDPEGRKQIADSKRRGFESEIWCEFRCAVHAFCESAPPTSASMMPRDTHALVLRWLGEIADVLGVELQDGATALASHARILASLQSLKSERDTAVEQLRILTEQLNAQAQSHGKEGERWSREMGELKRELEALKASSVDRGQVRSIQGSLDSAKAEIAALKAAPARVEREVDVELRDALRCSASREQPSERVLNALDRWLAAPLSAAPLSAAPAQDEYTKAAVEFAEAWGEGLDLNAPRWIAARSRWRDIYDARKRGEASAFRSRPPPADALAPFPDGPAVPPMAVCGGTNFNPPAPADERVTLYIPEFRRGMSGLVYSSSERSRVVDVQRWLAIDARVVREGGAA